MVDLERAIVIAAEAHAGQVDKAKEPYILHPIRVMLRLTSPEQRIVAILHDVVEDSSWTFAQLRAEGLSEELIVALDAVTKRDNESYEDFVRRAATNSIGRAVKRADLLDNLDLTRIASPTERDHARLEKYRNALALLESLSS